MNNLSLLIYLAEVLGNLGTVLAVIFGIGLLMSIILFVIYLVDVEENGEYRDKTTLTLYPYRYAWMVCACVCVFASLIPSKETVYAIAVSEMGEEVLNSNIGNKSLQALENWLDDQLEEDTTSEDS